MERKLLFFGNGLGMSLDPDHFRLETAIQTVWGSAVLDEKQKELISNCLPEKPAGSYPKGEHELGLVQGALVACDVLSSLSDGNGIDWLSEEGRDFPNSVRSFINHVAAHFFNFQGALPPEFISSLIKYVKASKSHVATTNYDRLLYRPFIEHKVLDGFNGSLVDGILGRGFARENLDRKFNNDFGIYFHLHGSPLYYTDDKGFIKKWTQPQFDGKKGIPSKHIVLTHIDYKQFVIQSSSLLAAYADAFERAIDECGEIIVFGYGGRDEHLNTRMRRSGDKKKIRVVERMASGERDVREPYWKKCLGDQVELIQLESILDFTDW